VPRAGLTHTTAPPRAAIVYTDARTLHGGRTGGRLDAVHLGLVLRVAPVLLSIDGATTIATYDREGFVQALEPVDQSASARLCLAPRPRDERAAMVGGGGDRHVYRVITPRGGRPSSRPAGFNVTVASHAMQTMHRERIVLVRRALRTRCDQKKRRCCEPQCGLSRHTLRPLPTSTPPGSRAVVFAALESRGQETAQPIAEQ
jgi:hypothetical protein